LVSTENVRLDRESDLSQEGGVPAGLAATRSADVFHVRAPRNANDLSFIHSSMR
jgi:hypothetical protein